MPDTSCHLTRPAGSMGPSYQVHVTKSPQILISPASAWLKKCTYNSTLSCLLMIKHIYIHLKFNHLSIYNSCFIIHIQTQLILVSSGATCYSIGNLFIDLGPTFLLSVQPQYFRVGDDHEYDRWWQKGQYSKNVYLPAPNLPFKKIQSNVPIFWCWSGHWENTKKMRKISGQDPNLK